MKTPWELDVERRDKLASTSGAFARLDTFMETQIDRVTIKEIYQESGECYICGDQLGQCGHAYTRKSPKVRNCNLCEWHEFCTICKIEVCGKDMFIGDLCEKCYHGNTPDELSGKRRGSS